MRLKKLTIQAFGPFKDKVEIDFESRNINSGLLLISGDTGAGKTSIFDAICFALYGEASGESRKTNSLRSDFASNDVETFVKLEFYHNNKLYEIKRSPEYYRQSKRGDGLTKQAPVAEFEINGRIETKTSVVTKEIENLLGLDYKQFHQVCMLSQGEFTKFLLASSDEKDIKVLIDLKPALSDDEFDSADLYKQREYARREMMVAKIVKQAKQMALAKMGREEKRIEKLIAKIEEKIKKKEAKDRERLAREEARIEAQRQAALERERRKEAKRKALEKAAVERAQEVERKLNERKKAQEKANAGKIADMAKMHPLLEKKRLHLKELREKERGKWDNPDDQIPEIPQETAMPVRRRDDYDDLSDEELEALMAENEMLDVPGNLSSDDEVEKPKKKVVKKVIKKAEPEATEPKKEEKKKAKKAIEEISEENLDELSDEELDALLGLNSGFTDFNAADVAGDDDLDDSKPVLTKRAKGEAPKPKKKEAEAPVDDFDSFMDSIPEKEESNEPKPEVSMDELDEALEDNKDTAPKEEAEPLNDIVNEIPNEYEVFPEAEEPAEEAAPEAPADDFDSFMDSIPEKEEAPEEPEAPIEEPVEEAAEAEEAVEEPLEEPVEAKPKEAPKASDRDAFADIVNDKKNDAPVSDDEDDFDNMSDEELEALMAQNDML